MYLLQVLLDKSIKSIRIPGLCCLRTERTRSAAFSLAMFSLWSVTLKKSVLMSLYCCEKTVEISCPDKVLHKVVEFSSRLHGFYLFLWLWENMAKLCSRASLEHCLV